MSAVTKNREQLIDECQGLVRSLALRVHKTLPRNVELDDLVSYGQVGLAEAARDFDAARGGQFSTFAYYRVRGAIYDGLSKMSWLSRAQFRRLKYEQMADETLRLANERAGDAGGVAWLKEVTGALAIVYLSSRAAADEQSESMDLADPDGVSPPQAAIDRETTRMLGELIDGLPDESRQLIRATYFEGLTLTEAGQRLGIGKAWASRLHARALERLGRALRLAGVRE